MKSSKVFQIALQVLVAIAIVVAGYFVYDVLVNQKEEQKARNFASQEKYVLVDTLSYTQIETNMEATGRVLSGNPVTLIPEVQGMIVSGKNEMKKGNSFKKGQLLCSIDDTEYRYNLNAARSQFMTLLANALPDIRIDYANEYDTWYRFFDQVRPDNILPQLPIVQNTAFKTFLASKGILNQFYNIRSMEARLSKYLFIAPFDGYISEVMLYPGNVASPGTPIARIMENNDLEIEVPIPTEDVQWIAVGTEAIIYNQNRSAQVEGSIQRIADQVDPLTQSVHVYVEPASHPAWIYEGSYFSIQFPSKTIDRGYEISRSALVNQNEIYTISGDSTLEYATVNVLKKTTETIIFDGVEEGTMIVVESVFNAYPGQRVVPALIKSEE